jgi:DNA polymerase II small subunit/DNA polymerase delta subunit B
MAQEEQVPGQPDDPKTGQDPEEDPEEETEEESQEDDDEAESSSDDKGGKPEDPLKMSPEAAAAEIARLRRENARRRTSEKNARKAAEEARKKASKDRTDAEKAAELETENKRLAAMLANQIVVGDVRDYVAEKHPQYAKLASRIAKDVDLDDLDPTDSDAVRDAVEAAVEAFVKDVPIGKPKDEDEPVTDNDGNPVSGGPARAARGGTADKSGDARRRELFPTIYGQTREG